MEKHFEPSSCEITQLNTVLSKKIAENSIDCLVKKLLPARRKA